MTRLNPPSPDQEQPLELVVKADIFGHEEHRQKFAKRVAKDLHTRYGTHVRVLLDGEVIEP